MYADFLHIQDFSLEIGKKHTLKVEQKKNEVSDLLAKEYDYEDKGVREIKEWIARSPLGTYKVVLLENIERMTISSANALLKTIEEPWENRLILATTSSLSSLLDTIASRALLIPCREITTKKISDWLQREWAVTHDDALVIAQLSQWKIGFAKRLSDTSQEQTSSLLSYWKEYKQNILDKKSLVSLAKLFEKINKAWMFSDFLELMHYESVEHNNWLLTDAIVQSKKYIERNVNTDSVMTLLAKKIAYR